MPTIYNPPPFQRYFAMTADPNSGAGGSNLETIQADATNFPGGVIPDVTSNMPVTTANFEWNDTKINRSAEVTSARAPRADIPFKVQPTITWTTNAYRWALEKLLKYTLGAEGTITGSGPYVHPINPQGFGSSIPPSLLVQLIQDAANRKSSGVVMESVDVTFPFDGAGTVACEAHALYSQIVSSAQPTGIVTEPNALPMVLRDCFVVFDGGTPIVSPTAPSLAGSGTGGTIPAGTYNYRISAINTLGETVPGPEAASPVVTTGTTSSVVVTWAAVTGATGYKVYGRTPSGELLLSTLGAVTTYTDTGAAPSGGMPSVNTTAGGTLPIGISQFHFGFKNNGVYERQVAGRCVDTRAIGTPSINRQLWFPYYHKISARQTVTFGLNFLDTQLAQELAREWGQVQKVVVTVGEPNVPGNQAVFSLFATEITGGGVDALTATGDQTSAFTGGAFYSASDGTDVQVSVTNSQATAIV